MGAGVSYPAAASEISALTEAALRGVPTLTGRPDYTVAGVLMPLGPLAEVAGAAAIGWKLLGWGTVQRVVLLIPASGRSRARVSVPDFERWVGPWGDVAVDVELARSLAERFEYISIDRSAFVHAGLAEAQLPLMLAVAGGVKLLPMVLGDETAGLSKRVAQALLRSVPIGPTTVVIALGSPPADAAPLMAELAPLTLRNAMRAGRTPPGPLGPVSAVLDVGRALRSDPPRALAAEMPASPFALLVPIARGPDQAFSPPPFPEDPAWTDKLQQDVLEIAKKSVVGHVVMGHKARFGVNKGGLGAPSGVFVSVRAGGTLRGRSGVLEAGLPLGQATADAAYDAVLKAAPPMTRRDLSSFEVEVTIPGAAVELTEPGKLSPGRVGVVAIAPETGAEGVVLPQEAGSLGWGAPEAMRHACMQAGLPPECRKDDRVSWRTFPTRVFRTDPDKPLPPAPPGPARKYGPAGSGLGLAREALDR